MRRSQDPPAGVRVVPAVTMSAVLMRRCGPGSWRCQQNRGGARKVPPRGWSGLAAVLLPDGVAPHLVALLLQVRRRDDEARVEQQLLRLLAGPHVLEGLEGH